MVGQHLTYLILLQVPLPHLDSAANYPAHHDPLVQLRLQLLGLAVVIVQSGPIYMHNEGPFMISKHVLLLVVSSKK